MTRRRTIDNRTWAGSVYPVDYNFPQRKHLRIERAIQQALFLGPPGERWAVPACFESQTTKSRTSS